MAESSELERTVYVSNISNEAPWKTDLMDTFKEFGAVANIDYIQPRLSNRFAFITFSSLASAKQAFEAAVSENGIHYHGHKLYVAPRRPKRSKMKKDVQTFLKKYREWQPTGPALIDQLNVYCMLQIFGYLPLGELVACERVCKRWREISLKSWATVEELSLSHIFPKLSHAKKVDILKRAASGALRSLNLGWNLSQEELVELLKVVPPSITSFTITSSDMYLPEVLDLAAKAMPNLKKLGNMSGSANLDDERLFKLLTAFPQVNDLTMGVSEKPFNWPLDWANIQRLQLALGQVFRSDVVPSLISRIGCNLEELSWCQTCMGNIELALSCPKLKKFAFGGYFPNGNPRVLIDFSGAPQVEELSICKEHIHCKDGRENMLRNCPHVTKLKLLSTDGLDPSLCFLLFQNWPKLTHLNINYSRLPGKMKELEKLKELKKLSMRGTEDVYEQELVSLIDALPKLTYLDISRVQILAEDGSEVTDVESLCNKCLSDGRPILELVILGCGFDKKEQLRWRCGRFILYNPIWLGHRF